MLLSENWSKKNIYIASSSVDIGEYVAYESTWLAS